MTREFEGVTGSHNLLHLNSLHTTANRSAGQYWPKNHEDAQGLYYSFQPWSIKGLEKFFLKRGETNVSFISNHISGRLPAFQTDTRSSGYSLAALLHGRWERKIHQESKSLKSSLHVLYSLEMSLYLFSYSF